jgi:prevent-host-death family protein
VNVLNPATHTVTVSEARNDLETLVHRVGSGETRVMIEQNGEPVAALVSAEDLAHFEKLALRERLAQIMDEVGRAFADVPDDELEREIDKAVSEVRDEMRAERAANRQPQ